MKLYISIILIPLLCLLPQITYAMSVPSSGSPAQTEIPAHSGGYRDDTVWKTVGITGIILINMYALSTLDDPEKEDVGKAILYIEGYLLIAGGIVILILLAGFNPNN